MHQFLPYSITKAIIILLVFHTRPAPKHKHKSNLNLNFTCIINRVSEAYQFEKLKMDLYNNNSWEQEASSSPQAASDEEVILASSCPKKKAGRKKFKETRHPVYRGVRRRNNNRWVCELRAPNNKTRIWLGTYPTAEMAARAHDVAALATRGRMACLNFADSAATLPVPASGDIKDIQRAAAEAAELFRPQDQEEMPEQVTGQDEETVQESYNAGGSGSGSYMDEEATFQMPNLLSHMAEGMLMSPPHHDMYESTGWGEVESECEVSLWSFSI